MGGGGAWGIRKRLSQFSKGPGVHYGTHKKMPFSWQVFHAPSRGVICSNMFVSFHKTALSYGGFIVAAGKVDQW